MELLTINTNQPFSVYNLYLICLYVGVLYTAFVFVFGEVFNHEHPGGMGDNFDVSVGGDVGVSPLHPMVIAAFVTSFGAVGVFLNTVVTNAVIGILLATVIAVIISALFFFGVIKTLYKAQASSTFDMKKSVGVEGTVTVTIPADGLGEVAFVAKQKRYTASALSTTKKPIKQGEPVVIVKRVDNVLYVKQI